MRGRRWIYVLFGAVIGLCASCDGCSCEGCDCSKARNLARSHLLADPDEATAKRLLVERLRTAKDVASNMCGVPVEGLTDVKVTWKARSDGRLPSRMTVEGKPVLAKGRDGGIDPAKLAVCIGVVMPFFSPTTDDEGKVTDWKLGSVELEEVKTPGVKWSPPRHDHDWD